MNLFLASSADAQGTAEQHKYSAVTEHIRWEQGDFACHKVYLQATQGIKASSQTVFWNPPNRFV